MILSINTAQNDLIEISLKNRGRLVAVKKFKSRRTQAEKLLPAVEKLLRDGKFKLSDLKKIEVENRGGSFTSLRVGVVTANALGYALNIPVVGEGDPKIVKNGKRKFSIVEPSYSSEPEITAKKQIIGKCG